MVYVCIECGWLAFDAGARCRCGGLCVSHRAAAVACNVGTLFELLHVSPARRVMAFQARRAALRAGGRGLAGAIGEQGASKPETLAAAPRA